MNFLIIDAALNKICFFSKFNNYSYNQSYESSKNNYEQFAILLTNFLTKNKIDIAKIKHLFINQGPGNFSGIRSSLATAKGLSMIYDLNLYGFNANDVKSSNYSDIIILYNQKKLKKNLIKPLYLS
tara:strand:+ start:176 stop:553 length:378 start_codon:yes stop_codon:yes gene_type:complete